jgi:putative transcriptional regulator
MSGGPVQPERGFVLHPSDSKWQSTLEVSPDISLTASRDIIVALAEGRGPKQYLITLGYAGWGEGQLEEEIASNSWLTVQADKDVIFNTPFEQRWTAAAQTLGIDVNLISSTAGHA